MAVNAGKTCLVFDLGWGHSSRRMANQVLNTKHQLLFYKKYRLPGSED